MAMLGRVASRLMVTEIEAGPPALVAAQVKVLPPVSEVTEVGSHPGDNEVADSGSVTLQLTRTSLVNQPLLPSVPRTSGAMTGGVMSCGSNSANGGRGVARPHTIWLAGSTGKGAAHPSPVSKKPRTGMALEPSPPWCGRTPAGAG